MYIFFLIHCQDGHNILPEEDYFTCLTDYNTDFIFSRVIQLSEHSPGLAVTAKSLPRGSPRCVCEIALAQVERKDTAGFPWERCIFPLPWFLEFLSPCLCPPCVTAGHRGSSPQH